MASVAFYELPWVLRASRGDRTPPRQSTVCVSAVIRTLRGDPKWRRVCAAARQSPSLRALHQLVEAAAFPGCGCLPKIEIPARDRLPRAAVAQRCVPTMRTQRAPFRCGMTLALLQSKLSHNNVRSHGARDALAAWENHSRCAGHLQLLTQRKILRDRIVASLTRRDCGARTHPV